MIAGWEVLPDRNLLRRDDDAHTIEPRLIQVLIHLAAHQGQVVLRNELLESVWGETIVQEEALTQAVSQLRRIMGDNPRTPTIIETVPKKGYRLIAEVTSVSKTDGSGEAAPQSMKFPVRWAMMLVVVAGFVLVYFLIGGGESTESPQLLLDTRPLTSLPGDEFYPAISPDGQHVVFTWRPKAGAEFKLHLKKIGAGDPYPLTDEPGVESLPCWSPDGERIAFLRLKSGERRVCVVSAIGGPVQELTSSYWVMGGMDWSPDGKTIVFSCKDRQEAPMRLMQLHGADGQLDTLTTPEFLSRGDTYPRFSPDGSRLALIRSDRGITRDVFLMPAAGGEPTRLTSGFFSCGGVDWAPDGKSLVLSATLRGTYDLWRVDAANGKTTLMPARTNRSLHPAWSERGGSLVFVNNTDVTDLVVGSLANDSTETSVASSTRIDVSGRISPDGKSILFMSDRGGSDELWLLDRSTNAVRQLTDFAGGALRKPRWSPNGRWVAVNTGRESLLQIVVINVTSGMQRQVTSAAVHHRLGHWSADGEYIFYSHENGPDWQIAKVRLDGTGAVDVAAPGCLSLYEQQNGDLYYFKETEEGLFKIQSPGNEDKVVEPVDLPNLANMQVDDHGFWFIRKSEDISYLTHYDYATGQLDDRVVLQGTPNGEFHLAVDGKTFVYTSVVQTGNDLMIVPDMH